MSAHDERILVEPELLNLGYRPMTRTHSEPKYKVPPKRKFRPQTPRRAAQSKAAKKRQREKWLLDGNPYVRPTAAERAWLAEQQRSAA